MFRLPIGFVPGVANATADVTSRANYASALLAATSEACRCCLIRSDRTESMATNGPLWSTCLSDLPQKQNFGIESLFPTVLTDTTTSQETKSYFLRKEVQ